jgi:nucleoside-diphosphate-sugar epimerase
MLFPIVPGTMEKKGPTDRFHLRSSQVSDIQTVLVTGGAGYVGAVLVPKLIEQGYRVKVVDLYLFGDHVLEPLTGHPNLEEIKGDIRDVELLRRAMLSVDAVIHLACISNDPSYELDPALGKSINYDAFTPLVQTAKDHQVKRFIYASSSSVYGIKDEPDVTEDLALEPLTDYSRFKAECERILLDAASDDFTVTVIRPATVCGYSPRLRLDLTVNILTNHAVNRGEITVFGGEQKRPNIHIEDMTDLYLWLLKQPAEKIHKEVFNAGYENFTVMDIARMVNNVLGGHISIKVTPTADNRSYHISSAKIAKSIGFRPKHTLEEAVADLKRCFDDGKIPNPMDDIRYYNIRTMEACKLA